MHQFRAISLIFALALSALAWAADPPGLMHIVEPVDAAWIKPVPGLKIPPPPTDKGLTISEKRLIASEPLSFNGNDSLAAEAAKPKGVVTGKGTKESPYLIRNLAIRGITDKAGIFLGGITAPLIIENVLFEGIPVSPRNPARGQGIEMDRCGDIIIRHCQASRCGGFISYNSSRLLFEDNFLYSTDTGIYTMQGDHNTARGNYVRDSDRYGVFLYHGPYHIIENNYVTHCGREGIGTNGNGHDAIYRNNVILHTGWTAINVEGDVNGVITENNLVVDTFYGIVLLGSDTITRKNRIYNSSQAGIILNGYAAAPFSNVKIEDNEIYNSGSVGIDCMKYNYDVFVRRNKIWQSDTAIKMNAKRSIVEGNDIYRFMSGIDVGEPGSFILDNKLYRGRNPINIGASNDTTISGNDIHNNLQGITVGAAKNVLIVDNKFDTNMAVWLTGSTEVTIRKNDIFRVPYGGINFNNATKCVVENNNISSGDIDAVNINGGSGNTVKNNTISDMRGLSGNAAITLIGTTENVFSGNTFTRNAAIIILRDAASTGNTFEKNIYQDNPLIYIPVPLIDDFIKNNTLEEALTKK